MSYVLLVNSMMSCEVVRQCPLPPPYVHIEYGVYVWLVSSLVAHVVMWAMGLRLCVVSWLVSCTSTSSINLTSSSFPLPGV